MACENDPPTPFASSPFGMGPMRLRRSPALRRLVRQTNLLPRHLVQPLFVVEDATLAGPIDGLRDQRRLTVDQAVEAGVRAQRLGLGGVLLFGVPANKTPHPETSGDFLLKAIARLRAEVPELLLITDVCLCPYTEHGHCCVYGGDGSPDLEATRRAYGRLAVEQAGAGAQMVAPSGMIDGTVGAVRGALDAAGMVHMPIMAYSVKHASGLYGPFRGAANSTPGFGDRRWHQMDPANAREALAEIELDLAQGADIVMVKPAVHALDVIASARRDFPRATIAAYHVSGEFSMLSAAAERRWVDWPTALHETLYAIRRAGADIVITYGAIDWASRPEPEQNCSGTT